MCNKQQAFFQFFSVCISVSLFILSVSFAFESIFLFNSNSSLSIYCRCSPFSCRFRALSTFFWLRMALFWCESSPQLPWLGNNVGKRPEKRRLFTCTWRTKQSIHLVHTKVFTLTILKHLLSWNRRVGATKEYCTISIRRAQTNKTTYCLRNLITRTKSRTIQIDEFMRLLFRCSCQATSKPSSNVGISIARHYFAAKHTDFTRRSM